MRTVTQKIIIPRNWLFGRLSFINNNLKSITGVNTKHFTGEEIDKLLKAQYLITSVIKDKKKSSEKMKQILKKYDRLEF